MKPLEHAEISVKKYGGKIEDYIRIHTLMDFSKSSVPDVRHRMMFHHSAGIWFMEEIFGAYVINSDDKKVATRDIAEHHVLDDLGFIPTLARWTDLIIEEPWMCGAARDPKTISPELQKAIDEIRKGLKEIEPRKIPPPLFPHPMDNFPPLPTYPNPHVID